MSPAAIDAFVMPVDLSEFRVYPLLSAKSVFVRPFEIKALPECSTKA